MSVQILKKIRETTGLKNYGIHKRIASYGCKITLQGLDGYDKATARSIRIDVLNALERLCIENGIAKEVFWNWIKEEG